MLECIASYNIPSYYMPQLLNKICLRAFEDDEELVIVGRSNDGRKDEPRRALPVSEDLTIEIIPQ